MRNSQSPASAAPARITVAMRQARSATLRRAFGGRPCVMARNAGTSPIGSTTTSSVTRAEIMNSRGIAPADMAAMVPVCRRDGAGMCTIEAGLARRPKQGPQGRCNVLKYGLKIAGFRGL